MKQNTRARTYQLDQLNIDRIAALAALVEAHPSRIVNMILARGLTEIEAGRWAVDRRPVVYNPVWNDDEARRRGLVG